MLKQEPSINAASSAQPSRSGESGMSLVSVMVSMVLASIVAGTMMKTMSDSAKSAASSARLQEETNMRELIKQRFSCNFTFPKEAVKECHNERSQDKYTLKDTHGNDLPDKMGYFEIWTKCERQGGDPSLVIEVLDTRTDVLLKNKQKKDRDYKRVFTKGSTLCTAQLKNQYDKPCTDQDGKEMKDTVVTGVDSYGKPICGKPEFAQRARTVDYEADKDCATGMIAVGVNKDGSPKCVAKANQAALADRAAAADMAARATSADRAARASAADRADRATSADTVSLNNGKGWACPAGHIATGIQASGAPTCQPLKDVLATSASCPAGQVQIGVVAGAPVCTIPGSNLGGFFQRYPGGGGRFCRVPNPKTGNCSCPSGFTETYVSEYHGVPGDFGNGAYCDATGGRKTLPPGNQCGYTGFVCLR